MLSSFLLQVSLAALSTSTVVYNGFLSVPATREPLTPLISRRDDTNDTTVSLFDASQYAYLIELDIGTPGQLVKVAIDTGSSELWVDPDCDVATDDSLTSQCNSFGYYDYTLSTSFEYLNYSNTIRYGIGWAGIEYGADTIAIQNTDINLTNLQFGVAITSRRINEGILGLSFGGNSSTKNSSIYNLNYNGFIDELYLQRLTQIRAFSIALAGADDGADAVITFGGIDTSKFAGPLYTLPILDPQNDEDLFRYWITLNNITDTALNGTTHVYSNSSFPVVVDTGSTFCAFPLEVIEDMMERLGGQNGSNGEVDVDCTHMKDNSTFDFGFGNFTIEIPYSEFIMDAGDNTCFLGATASTGNISVLGDSFLRSTYVVFDQRNLEISMAQYNNCGTSEQVITTDGVSGITGNCKTASDGGEPTDEGAGSRLSADIFGLLAVCMSLFVFLNMI